MKTNRCTIRVWTKNKDNPCGHMSMETTSFYMSLWPSGPVGLLNETPGEFVSRVMDLQRHERTPNVTITLYTLNTSAMDKMILQQKIIKRCAWTFRGSNPFEETDISSSENSATLVLKILKTGGLGDLVCLDSFKKSKGSALLASMAEMATTMTSFTMNIPAYRRFSPDNMVPILQLAQREESKKPAFILMTLLMKPPLTKYLDKLQLDRLLSLENLPKHLNKRALTVKIKESQSIDSGFIQNIMKLDSLPCFQVTELHLIGCEITDNLINEAFVQCISTLNLLDTLNLTHNRITYTGALELSSGIKKHPTLRVLNLSGNAIVCAPKWLSKLEKRFSACRALKEIVIDSNFLDPECERVELLCPSPERISFFRYGLFSSHVQPSRSLLEPESRGGITPMHWMICLACKKGTEHSILFLEGMRQTGQKFLERYHLQASSIAGQARISMERFDPVHFNRNNYYQASKRITEAQGTSLQDHVKRDHDKPNGIPFSKCYPGSKTHNCLTWSKRILKAISIKTKLTVYPSTASKKGFI